MKYHINVTGPVLVNIERCLTGRARLSKAPICRLWSPVRQGNFLFSSSAISSRMMTRRVQLTDVCLGLLPVPPHSELDQE